MSRGVGQSAHEQDFEIEAVAAGGNSVAQMKVPIVA